MAVSNQYLIFPCFNVIQMIGTYRCNYIVYGPQVCSWVLDCLIGPIWQVAIKLWHISTSRWPHLSFYPRPVAELFLCFAATLEQIACSELGPCLGLGVLHIVFVQVNGCCDIAGGLYRAFLHQSFNQSKLFVLCIIFYWLVGGLSFAVA